MYGFNPDDKIVLSVGKLAPHKGYQYLLWAARRYESIDNRIKTLIIGEGGYRDSLIQIKTALNLRHVYFLGLIPSEKLVDYYNMADIMVIPSLEEHLGIVALEAMACETPVLASCVGGLKEIIREGKNGFFIEPQDSVGFADKIIWLLENKELRKTIGRYGRKWVLRKFSLKSMIRKYRAIYKKIAGVKK